MKKSFRVFLKFQVIQIPLTVGKCPYLGFFWSLFSHIRTEYGYLQSKYPCLVRMRENTQQKNSQYRHFLHSDCIKHGSEKSRILIYFTQGTRRQMFQNTSGRLLPYFVQFDLNTGIYEPKKTSYLDKFYAVCKMILCYLNLALVIYNNQQAITSLKLIKELLLRLRLS